MLSIVYKPFPPFLFNDFLLHIPSIKMTSWLIVRALSCNYAHYYETVRDEARYFNQVKLLLFILVITRDRNKSRIRPVLKNLSCSPRKADGYCALLSKKNAHRSRVEPAFLAGRRDKRHSLARRSGYPAAI